jgi:hypothetical protein
VSTDKKGGSDRLSEEALRKIKETLNEASVGISKQHLGEWPAPLPTGCPKPYYVTGMSRTEIGNVMCAEANWPRSKDGAGWIAPDGEIVRYAYDWTSVRGRPRGTLFYVHAFDAYSLPREAMQLLDEAEDSGWTVVRLPGLR